MNRSLRIAAIACSAIIVLVAFHTQEVAATPVESQSVEGDSDGDGLTDAQEAATVYFQDAGAAGLPSAIPNDGVNASTSGVALAPFQGIPVRALANFSITHARKTDLTAQIGYWDGSAWIDRYVWDPGKHLLSVGITQPDPAVPRDGTVPVVATVAMPDFTSKVEFRVDGALQATVTSPVGNEYRWTWPTSGDGPRILNVTQVDTVGGQAWDQEAIQVNNLGPAVAWQYPTNGASLSGPVTVWVSAPDYYGTQRVEFYLDGVLQFIDNVPEPASSDYMWGWDSSSVPVGEHTLAVVAYDDLFLLRKSTTSAITVTTVNDPTVSITYPAPNAQVSGTVTVQASASSVVSSIAYVNFYLGESFRHSDDTSPYTWAWDTTQSPNGAITLKVIAVRGSDGRTATAEITVHVDNTEECPPRGCPTGPVLAAPETAQASPASMTMGVLTSDWTPGETDVGTTATVVVDLVNPQSSASSAEMAARILRPAMPPSLFMTTLQWRLIVRDWVPPAPGASEGDVTAFVLRFEAKSDPWGSDTDGDGIGDGTEVNTWFTLPVTRDSDGDGLSEGYEIAPHTLTVWSGGASSVVAGFTTNPTLADTDGDGLTDGQERGLVTTGQSKVVGEVGLAVGVTDLWTKVYLRNKYTSPVVLAGPPTHRDPEAGIVRIRSVTDHTFELRFQEWSEVGGHPAEDVSYLVLEAGNHVLPDGSVVEAGTKTGVGTAYATATFREAFGQTPIVLAQILTTADVKAAAAKIRSVTAASFETYIRTNPIGTHGVETVGYVAIGPQADTSVLATWTRLAVGIGSATTGTIAFPGTFGATPRILAGLATEMGNADVGLRLDTASNASFSYSRETAGAPGPEIMHVFAFATSMNLTARLTTRPTLADTDGDALADGLEVNTHGSNPALRDTDADGIADNVEVADRSITIPVNGTARTFTFKTSPTSDDTDADGVKDPDEMRGILDHRVLYFDMETLASGSTFRDLSGNGADGAAKFVRITSSTPKKVGNSTMFNGTTGGSANRVLVPSSPALGLTGGFTILAWVYPTTTSQASGAGIVAKGYGTSAAYVLDVVVSGSSKVFRAYVGSSSYEAKSTTAISSNTWYLVAAVYDPTAGTLQLYVNLNAPVTRTAVPSMSANAHDVSIGSRESTPTSGYDLSFKGRLDEVQIWDRPLGLSEIRGAYNATTSAYQARLDFETRTPTGHLFDFSGTYHRGIPTGTSVVEGRTGFARRLAGGNDGIVLASSSGISVSSSTGATVDVLVLASSYPSRDASLVARLGSFYLNLSSDGSVRWSLHKVGTVATPLPIPLNRWVRITASASAASASTLSLYLDGALVASGPATSFPSTTNPITIGYTSGQAHVTANVDEFTLHKSALSATTIAGLGPAGIRLNPNATDTDFDGLADGQELFVKSVKTPKRYPTRDQLWVSSDKVDLALGVPAWAISRVDAMVGFTHEDMVQVDAVLNRWTGTSIDRSQTLRSLSNPGEANNFTSYDLMQKSSLSSTWFSREDFVLGGRTWYLEAYDRVINKKGQIEYLQLQVTVHTLPNRADTDVDGLNDSEELNLGSDGFSTDPWKVDTDGDTLLDNEVALKGTSPVVADTDRDGVRDDVDRAPLGDAFVEIRIDSTSVVGSDGHNAGGMPLPFVKASLLGNETYTPRLDARSGSWITTDFRTLQTYTGHRLTVNIADDLTSVTVTLSMWSYDSRGLNEHMPIVVGSHTEMVGGVPVCVDDLSVTLTYNVQAAGQSQSFTLRGCAGSSLYADPLTVTLATIVPNRIVSQLVVPADYAGVYNVTDPGGQTIGRRYVGEPRFVAFLLNETTWEPAFQCYCGPAYPRTILVPRSLFFESRLYGYLNASNPVSPLNKLAFRQNSTSAASNSDELQQILTGNVTTADVGAILDLLTRNGTNVLVHLSMPLPNDLFLYSLPDGAVRIVGYDPPPTAYSWTYTFAGVGTTSRPWWELVWTGIVATVTGFLTSAFVLAATAFAKLVEVLAQVGAWLADLLSGDPVRVERAVKAAQKAFDGFVNGLLEFAKQVISQLLPPALAGVALALGVDIDTLRTSAGDRLASGEQGESFAKWLVDLIFSGRLFWIAVGIGVALMIISGILLASTAGLVAAAAPPLVNVIAAMIQQLIIKALLVGIVGFGAALALTAIFYLAVPSSDPFWHEGVGIQIFSIASVFVSIFSNAVFSSIVLSQLGGDIAGLIFSIFGLALQTASGSQFADRNTQILYGALGLYFAGAGFALTMLISDVNDKNPLNPFRWLEEVFSGIGAAYSVAAFASFFR